MTPFSELPLPVLFHIAPHRVFDLRPVVNQGNAMPIGDLAAAAYGFLEGCGWLEVLQSAPAALTPEGRVDEDWKAAALDAAQRLALEGASAGPDGDLETWLAWLALEHGVWPSGT